MDDHQDSDGVTPEISESQSEYPPHATWRAAADGLRRSHLGDLAALCIEALGPLALVASQLLYAGGPFLGERAIRWGRLLESDVAISSMSRYLSTGSDDHKVVPKATRD